jgi:hypothetical protein
MLVAGQAICHQYHLVPKPTGGQYDANRLLD